MPPPPQVAFLFDVDNTLLDNDAVQHDLSAHLQREVGRASRDRYWQIFEELRSELGYADYLGALQRYRDEYPRDPHVLHLSPYLIDYPFANRLYPESLDVLEWLKGLGQVAILSDGDVVFQPRKVERAGLWHAFEDRVLIYVHKEQRLDDVRRELSGQVPSHRRQCARAEDRDAWPACASAKSVTRERVVRRYDHAQLLWHGLGCRRIAAKQFSVEVAGNGDCL